MTVRSPIASRLLRTSALCAVVAVAGIVPRLALAEEITVWSGYPEMEPFYKHVAEGMKKAHPDLTVNVQAITLREHEKRVALALASGSASDVVELSQSTAQRYLEGNLLQPASKKVTDFVKATGNFDPFFVTSVTDENKVVAVPLFRGQGALYYNTDMFAKAGLSGPPMTMDEYTTDATKLTQRDAQGNPTVSGWSMRLSGGGQGIAEKFWINMFQYGGNVLEQNKAGKWRATYATPAGRATLKQYLDNVFAKKNVTVSMPADADAFERQQTAMFIRESWVVGDIAQKAPTLKYATAPLPKGSIVATNSLYVASKGAKSDLAWEFALATNEPENLTWMLDKVGWLPNRKNVDYSSIVAKTPALKAFVDVPANYGYFALPVIGPADEVLTKLANRLTSAYGDASLVGNDAAIDAFLKTAADETDSILKREGIYGAP